MLVVEEATTTTTKDKNEDEGPPLLSSMKTAPPSSENLDDTESSFGGDFIGVFRSYLRGDETVEDTRRRIVTRKRHGGANGVALAKGETIVSKTKKDSRDDFPWWLTILRTLLLDLPLALLFASFVAVWLIREIHTEYYAPLILRAQRTDEQLLEEFTYYERQCTEYDLSTRDIQELLVDVTKGNDTIPAALDQMMKHGGTVIPSVLQPATVKSLRDFVVRKNNRITAAEAYPVSQGERRLSYGIDASEDPAVSAAIQEVANHPVIRPLIAALLGDNDPASAEITAITAYDGAEHQAWHQDTKQDGNALKYARTYSHSYSLFLPLQDTTEKMGATDICPGTHYCANDIADMCENTKMGLHLVGGKGGAFPAGAGALLNQHVWHRGGAHTDPTAPERIVFILSFLARPNFDHDPRQLSRGTYFHQKWNMWGHTWKDLLSPATSMRYPFSLLRCLSLWKPADANWGYDLITSGFMRFANEQLEYEDFSDRFLPRLDQFGFPEFLRGRLLSDDATQLETWTVFIQETIDIVFNFVRKVNLYVHGVYLCLVFLSVVWLGVFRRNGSRGTRLLRRTMLRLTTTHCLLLVLGFDLWSTVRSSQWGRSIFSGHALMRPFPPVETVTEAQAATVTSGPTTLPTRNDVLLGTRFDAQFLGSYNKWLDYHPGNAAYREATAKYASSFSVGKNLGPLFSVGIVQKVIDEIQAMDGRFLQQDFRTGDWRILTETEVIETVTGDLVTSGSGAVADVRKSVDWMIALNRFGPQRGTPMARFSQLLLWHLRRRFLRVTTSTLVPPALAATASISSLNASFWNLRALPIVPKTMPGIRMLRLSRRQASIPSAIGDSSEIKVGSLIWSYYEDSDEWFPGTVMDADDDREWFLIAFVDNSWEQDVRRSQLHQFRPVTEGDRVKGCFTPTGLQDCHSGTVIRVLPGGYASIAYDYGDIDYLVPPSKYFVPPYRYEGPFFL